MQRGHNARRYIFTTFQLLAGKPRHRNLAGAFAVTLLLGAAPGFWLDSQAAAASLSLCGNQGTAPAITHVVVVMMENRSYKDVVGSSNAPFQTGLASECGNATSNFGATHTSAANYLATSAGEYPASSPRGCGSVGACADSANNLYNQLSSAGLSWSAFIEAMPSPCDPSSGGNYKIGHNPAIFYTDLGHGACAANDVGEADLTAQSGVFWNDLQNETLPSFSWVTPDEADDGEGQGSVAQKEQAADAWLQKFIALMEESNSYQAGNTLVLVSYDEGEGSDDTVGEDCANESLDLPVANNTSAHQDSCHVPLFVVYPYTTAGDSDATFFTHYSITKTVEDIFGLPYLGHAGDADTNSLIGHFGLSLPQPGASPSVSISEPTSGSTVTGAITIAGTASDSVGVTEVEVSVDGGAPQPASGTTSWTSSLDTTTLSNGTHTITALAYDTADNVGSAAETVVVSNPVTSACAAAPAGVTELSGNLSLEANQDGWTGVYTGKSSVTRVEPSGGSFDGSWALRIGPTAGQSGTAGVNNAGPAWVPGSPGTATVAQQTYTGSAEIAASAPGETISLMVRETTPGGAGINYHTTTMTFADTGWHLVSSSYTAEKAGDALHYSLYARNLASSAQYFLADCLSLQTPAS